VLHTVYEDAKLACDVLEKHGHTKAHFHWFKGPEETIKRMIANGYYISITPDVIYESEIQQLVERYPLERMMVETDGPWPFEGPFAGQMTHPSMMTASIEKIAEIKQLPEASVHQILTDNTKQFYNLNISKK
jgi:TatD DNase family protein